jgi:two-component system, LytTR family, response regulator
VTPQATVSTPGAPVRTLIVDDEPLARDHLRTLLEARGDISIIGECGDGASAVDRIRAEAPELVLLDVQMPERDGFDVVREIGPDRMPSVIFITAYDQHALSAFEVHALDYILKPINRGRFTRAIDRVVGLLRAEGTVPDPAPLARAVQAMPSSRPGADRLAVRVGERVLYLRIAEIDWIEAADDVVRLHVGKQVFEHRTTLAQLEQRLPTKTFVRIHRSTIINLERVREFQPWFQGDWIVILADGTRLQSGKSYRARLRELIDG